MWKESRYKHFILNAINITDQSWMVECMSGFHISQSSFSQKSFFALHHLKRGALLLYFSHHLT